MSANVEPWPKIEVQRWNAHNVYLRCPYCERTHSHGLALPGKRQSHCYPGGRYEFIFPIDELTGLVGYEIDKRRAFFVNVCEKRDDISSEATGASRDNKYDLSDHFRSAINLSAPEPVTEPVMKLREDSRELVTVRMLDETYEQKRILLAMSDCVMGELSSIYQYLSTTSEKHLFLHGRNERGDTTCIMSAAEKCHEMVLLLIENGADVNAVNDDGRSALMQAALWGRIETVEALVDAGANKDLLDHEGHSALDLAQPSHRNQMERYYRCSPAGTESMPERDNDRRRIAILLGEWRDENPSEKAIAMHGPIHNIYVPNIWQTAAHLDRGTQFPRITATGGWTPDALPPNRASAPTWTEQVYYLASIVGHRLEENPSYDQDKPGQFNACHAEKKLIAFFIDRHVFTPEDQTPNRALGKSIDEADYFLEELRGVSKNWGKVHILQQRKEILPMQILDAEDELQCDGVGSAADIERLKQQLDKINKELAALELQDDVRSVRSQEEVVRRLEGKIELHEELMKLSKNEPKTSSKEAAILTSNEICDDCKRFKDKVNRYFKLRIEIEYREERIN
ncbi:hypothetical protein F4808DRAFT_253444 [Astrocystis sublimbata]|nr:hypothetical protein F4808DRAFT_253444 [Astrocystis sublimbata]